MKTTEEYIESILIDFLLYEKQSGFYTKQNAKDYLKPYMNFIKSNNSEN